MAIERIIKGLTELNIKKLYQPSDVQQNKKPTGPGQAAGRSDEITISQRGVELQKASQAARELPDVRPQKVAELRKQIQAGTYKIDDDELLRKMSSG